MKKIKKNKKIFNVISGGENLQLLDDEVDIENIGLTEIEIFRKNISVEFDVVEEYRYLFTSDDLTWEQQTELYTNLSVQDKDILKLYTKQYENIEVKYMEFWNEFRNWMVWYPDLFYELLGEINKSKFKFHGDQKIMMREMNRKVESTLICNRRYGKSFLAIASEVVELIATPNRVSVYTADTQEDSDKVLKEKITELMNYFPFLRVDKNNGEIIKFNKSKGEVEIYFANGSRFYASNADKLRGSTVTGKIINDEWCFRDLDEMDNTSKASITMSINPKTGTHDPFDLNQIVNLSSAGFLDTRSHKEYKESVKRYVEVGDVFVATADAQLNLLFNRALTKQILTNYKQSMLPIYYKMNYDSEFGGGGGKSALPIDKLISCRNLKKPEIIPEKRENIIYMISTDFARAEDGKGDRTVSVVGKVYLDNKRMPIKVDIPAIIGIPKTFEASKQVLKLKKLDEIFKPHNQIWDANVWGELFVDEGRKEQTDEYGNIYPAFKAINPKIEREIETSNYKEHLYRMKTSGTNFSNSNVLDNFQMCFIKNKVSLLAPVKHDYLKNGSKDEFLTERLSHYLTDLFVQECLGSEINRTENGRTVINYKTKGRQNTKDVIMAVAYLLWFVFKVYPQHYVESSEEEDISGYLALFN